MYPSQHIILGLFFGIFVFIIFPSIGIFGILIIFLSSVLIDVDHYVYVAIRKKEFNLFKVRKWFTEAKKKLFRMSLEQRTRTSTCWCFLHGFEFMLGLILLGVFVSEYFFLAFVGILLHHILDYTQEPLHHKRIDKISSIYDFIKFRNMNWVDEKDN